VTPAGPVLHPELAAVSFLIGTWTGKGTGSYPGSEPFEYEEELTFSHGDKPVLVYAMRTWRGQPPMPSHGESGWPGSKEVRVIARRLWVDGDTLFDSLEMQAVGRELQAHVIGELHKKDHIAVA
jgi:hypothetical protein